MSDHFWDQGRGGTRSPGKVRGLLCTACNTSLGKFDHDLALLLAAVDYLAAPPAQLTINDGG